MWTIVAASAKQMGCSNWVGSGEGNLRVGAGAHTCLTKLVGMVKSTKQQVKNC